MERLDLIEAPRHQSVEAAIHLARYALALAHCRGRHVLDIACGEGYGSILMKLMGAKGVEGVDISEDAISKARLYCSTSGVRFRCADALAVETLFAKDTFDLVVSIETLEHVADPEAFLRSVKAVAKKNATIILTCPNDHWYYPAETQRNPHHVRKYTFHEFQRLATRILGRKVSWALGSGVLGFGTVPWSHTRDSFSTLGRTGWLKWRKQHAALFVPASIPDNRVNEKNCSYFVGTWGTESLPAAASTVFPMSMDKFMPLLGALMENSNNASQDFAGKMGRVPDEDTAAGAHGDGTIRAGLATTTENAQRPDEGALLEDTETLLARLPALEVELASIKADFEKCEVERQNELLKTQLLLDARQADADTITSLRQSFEESQTRNAELERESRKYRLQAAVLIRETEILQARLPALEAALASAEALNLEIRALVAQSLTLDSELVSAKTNLERLSQEHRRLLVRWNMVMALPRRIVPPAWRPPIKRALSKLLSRVTNR